MWHTRMIANNVWSSFLILGAYLAAPASPLTAYISYYTSTSSTTLTTRIAVAQAPPSHTTKRRRLYGLNSRFDRMLQEVSWASHTQKSSLPHRKHANLSSMADRRLPKIPTGASDEVLYGSRTLERCFVPATPENQLSEAMLWRSARLSPPQVVRTGDQDQVIVESPQELPEWLHNTLATLSPNHAVRYLTLSPDRPVRKDHIDWDPDASEDGSVFAFQAPTDGHHTRSHVETERQLRTDVASFSIAHDRTVGFQESCPTASLARSVPFSTRGLGWMSPQASVSCCLGRPFSALSMSWPTCTSTQKVMDTPPPFSTPGPFVSARCTNGHVSNPIPSMWHHEAYDKVLPTVESNATPSFPSSRPTKICRLDAPLDLILGNDERSPFSSSPKFTLNENASPLLSLQSLPSTNYFDPSDANPPKPKILPAFLKDGLAATSPGGFTWNSPTAMMRWSGATEVTNCDKPTLFLSDIRLDETTSYGHGNTKTLLSLHRPHVAAVDVLPQLPATPPPSLLSRRLPTELSWVPSELRTADIPRSIERVPRAHVLHLGAK
ncbi:hypothetical protein BJV74DRAFT_824481 [Russula compacta]|nr:hypothetical protein BJV74DRAFT_824481 [Russula compacta]